MSETMSRQVWLSALVHACVLLLVFLRAVLVPSENVMIRNAIRVDIVGLPDKQVELPAPSQPATKATPPPGSKKPTPSAQTTPLPTKTTAPQVSLKKERDHSKTQKDALKRLEQMQALEKIKGDISEQRAQAQAAALAKAAPAQPVKGNAVAEGNSLSGLSKIEFDRYFDDIKAKVFSNWAIPSWMADAKLKAQVNVAIDQGGMVVRKTIRRSSGNDIFDAKALEAVDASQPFPAPPARLRGLLATTGITFNFPE